MFCAGVLCGSCVAPCSPWGPPPRRREFDPRGALLLCTDDGPEGHGLMNMPQSTLRLRPRELCTDSSYHLKTNTR